VVAREVWQFYLVERPYGSFDQGGRHGWECVEGRYTMAFLMEYAATLGLIDVAYVSPVDARNDFRDRWGTDEFSCLSRYDGLLYVRVNALGAWCLGLAGRYEPPAETAEAVFKVLPNLDVVAPDKAPRPADVLLLERFAERNSENVWRLSAPKMVAAAEEGLTPGELADFLAARSAGPLPQTVTTFLEDQRARAEQLRDLGAARWVECADPAVAQLLVNDRRLRGTCLLAGERRLVFPLSAEGAVRKALRELGYPLPPPR
jgi:hypothetical protein